MVLLKRFKSRLFVKQLVPAGGEHERNARWDIAKIDDLQVNESVMARGGVEVENFRKGASCYAAFHDAEIVGSGWVYARSRLLRRLKISNAVYLGSFFVREAYRGQGIYKALLERMCLDCAGKYDLAVAETSESNTASVSGLESAGFKCAGELDVMRFMDFINIRCRMTTAKPF